MGQTKFSVGTVPKHRHAGASRHANSAAGEGTTRAIRSGCSDVRRTWPDHPIRTREVHGRSRPSNPFQIKKKECWRRGESNPSPKTNRYYSKREKAIRPGNSLEFPGRRIFMDLNYARVASPIVEKQAEVLLPAVLAGLESSPFFGVFVQTWTTYPYY